jgi:hypothetical protein
MADLVVFAVDHRRNSGLELVPCSARMRCASPLSAILGLNDVGVPQLPQHVPDNAAHRGTVIDGENFHVLVCHWMIPLARIRTPTLSKVIPGGAP